MLYKIDLGDIWRIIILMGGVFVVFVTIIILFERIFKIREPKAKQRKRK